MIKKQNVVIVGAGIAGLSAAHALEKNAEKAGVDINIDLVEKNNRIGGNILTEKKDGFTIEGGPDCVYSEKPAALELCKELGLEGEFLKTNDEKKGTYVFWNKRLHDLPEGVILMVPTMIKPMVFSSLISWPGKFRMAMEPLIPKRKIKKEETLTQFVSRRLGRELLEKIAEPLVAGIHAGNPDTMSINASFPRFVELEEKYGSLIKGMLFKKKQMLAFKGNSKTPKYTMFMSLKGGLLDLPNAIVKSLKRTKIHLNKKVNSVSKNSDGYETIIAGEKNIHSDALIIAAPSHAAAKIIVGIDSNLSDKLNSIPFVSTATISIAYPKSALLKSLKGFGFIVPRMAKRRIMAATMTSNKFSCRVPGDEILIRVFAGGAKNEESVSLNDRDMNIMVREELKDILGIEVEPLFVNIYRWEKSMPQYRVGHQYKVTLIEEQTLKTNGLYLTGTSYRGIGISEGIKSSYRVAEQLVNYLKKS